MEKKMVYFPSVIIYICCYLCVLIHIRSYEFKVLLLGQWDRCSIKSYILNVLNVDQIVTFFFFFGGCNWWLVGFVFFLIL